MRQRYVTKQMVNAITCTIELWMHLRGWLSTQEARLLRFFRAQQPPAFIRNSMVHAMAFTIC